MNGQTNARPGLGGGRTGGTRNDGSGRRPSAENYSATGAIMQDLRNGSGKVCATITGATLRKTVSRAKHQLRTPPAWALDAAHLDAAERAGCETVQLFDRDDGSTWTATVAAFRQHGFTFDRGFGRQVGLALTYWRHIMPGVPVPVQLAFGFGAGA